MVEIKTDSSILSYQLKIRAKVYNGEDFDIMYGIIYIYKDQHLWCSNDMHLWGHDWLLKSVAAARRGTGNCKQVDRWTQKYNNKFDFTEKHGYD